jgi:hypothetical protein
MSKSKAEQRRAALGRLALRISRPYNWLDFIPCLTLLRSERLIRERVRRHRANRRNGWRYVSLPVHEWEVQRLIAHGLLDEAHRDDPGAIVAALREGLRVTLFLA